MTPRRPHPQPEVMKLFTAGIYKFSKYASVSLYSFVGKPRSIPQRGRCFTRVGYSALKTLPWTNTRAHYKKFINYDYKKFYNIGPSTLVAIGSSTVAAAVVDADVVDADAVLSLDDSGGEWSEIVDHYTIKKHKAQDLGHLTNDPCADLGLKLHTGQEKNKFEIALWYI